MVPTTIGAVSPERMDPEEPTGFNLQTTPPLLYYFGNHTPLTNNKMFHKIMEKLANNVDKKMEKDPLCSRSGVLIDMCGWDAQQSQKSYENLLNAVDTFDVDTVLVLGSERLYSELFQKLSDDRQGLEVIKLAKSGGVVSRDKVYRRRWQMQRIREYFYGTPKFELSPYSTTVSFNDVSVRRIAEGTWIRFLLLKHFIVCSYECPNVCSSDWL